MNRTRGLDGAETVVFRLVVVAIFGLTLADGLAQAPYAHTQMPGPVGPTNATLNGMATARGYATTAWFEWGTDTTYGQTTTPAEIGSSARVVRITAPIETLAPNQVFHFRLVASNSVGVTVGADVAGTTGMRVANWGSQSIPSTPAGLSNVVAIACGHGHGLALRNDGTVVSWGVGVRTYYGDFGQTNVPSGLSNVVAVAGGWLHSLALRQDGTVVAWGVYASTTSPVTVPAGLSNVVATAGGDSHSLALKADGTLVGWGDLSVPRGLSNVVAIAAGSGHDLALKHDGKVVAWGSDLGLPTPPSSLSNVVAIATETWNNLALRADGTAVAWGFSSPGGQGSVPAGLSNIVAVATGMEHSLALKADGTLVPWGAASYVAAVPLEVTNCIAVASGDYHSLVLSPVNAQPRPFSPRIGGAMNSDRVIPMTVYGGWDPNGDPLHYRIAVPPTNGFLYQYAAAGRGDLIADPGTELTDPQNRVIFAPVPDTFGAPYTTFTFTANDGQVDSSPGLATLQIVPPTLIQAATFIPGTNGGLNLAFEGLSNASYRVSASTNCVNWTMLNPATQIGPGQFIFLDTSATNFPKRFYRVLSY